MFGWLTGSSTPAQETEQKGEVTGEVTQIPAPQNKDDFDQLFNKTLGLTLEYGNLEDPSWNFLQENDGFKLHEKIIPNSPCHLVRAYGVINASPQSLFEAVQESDLLVRNTWDPECIIYEVKEQIDDNMEIMHQAFKLPFPCTSRDFCALRARKVEPGRWITHGCSVVHSSTPETTDFVRGNALLSAFIFTPVQGKEDVTHVIHVACIDPKGWIPGFVVSSTKSKPIDRLSKLKAAKEAH